MWSLATWFSGRLGSAKLTIGLNDLKGLFQCKWVYDSIYLNVSAKYSLPALHRAGGESISAEVTVAILEVTTTAVEQTAWIGESTQSQLAYFKTAADSTYDLCSYNFSLLQKSLSVSSFCHHHFCSHHLVAALMAINKNKMNSKFMSYQRRCF